MFFKRHCQLHLYDTSRTDTTTKQVLLCCSSRTMNAVLTNICCSISFYCNQLQKWRPAKCYATYPFCITFFQIESYFLRAIFTMQTQYLYFRNVLTTTLPPSKNFSANHAICITCFQIDSYFLGDIVTTQSHYLYFRNVLAITLPQPQRLLREWCPHDTLLLKLYTNQNNI